MVKKILIAVVVLIVAFLGFAATRPDDFKVTRSGHMKAPADIVFGQINDLHKWAEWSPWDKLDPNMKKTYAGTASGPGSSYAWAGNDKTGEGKMTIVNSKAPNAVIIKLEFIKPFAATNTTQFVIASNGGESDVTWSMSGSRNFGMKVAGIFMDMDKMVGGDFEKGLAALSTVSEAEAKKAAAAPPTEAAAPAAAGPAGPSSAAKPN